MALTQISTAGVKDDAVTSGKIPANAVGSSELADNAVDTAAIADGTVTAAKLASGVQTTINNNADNRVITGSGTANTLNGEARLTFNGSLLTVSGYNDDNPVILDTDNGNGAHMRFQQQGSTKHYLGCGGGISMGNANQLSMRSTDHIHFGTGNSSTIRASFLNGGGLSFNGDTAAANALDDYEEGTWTPDFRVHNYLNNANSFTYSSRVGQYTKIGRQVHITAYFRITDFHTYTGNLYLFGLPFSPMTSHQPPILMVGDQANFTDNNQMGMFIIIEGGNSRGVVGHQRNTGWSHLTRSEFKTGVGYISGTYYV